jgi:hypothetical protein
MNTNNNKNNKTKQGRINRRTITETTRNKES